MLNIWCDEFKTDRNIVYPFVLNGMTENLILIYKQAQKMLTSVATAANFQRINNINIAYHVQIYLCQYDDNDNDFHILVN